MLLYILVLLTVSGELLLDGTLSWCSLQPVYVQDAVVYTGPADGIWGAPVGWDAALALHPAVYVHNTAVYPGPADGIRGVPGALSEKWTSFYVLYSGGHKCNSLWGVSLRSGVM
jgi:hypothetical protein